MDNERDLMAALLRMQEKSIDAQERHERQRQKTSHGLRFVLRGITVRRMLLTGADRCLERWKKSVERIEQVAGPGVDLAAAEAQVETLVAGLKLAASAIVDDAHRFELAMEEVRYLAGVERGDGVDVLLAHGPFLHPLPRVPMRMLMRDEDQEGAFGPGMAAGETCGTTGATDAGEVCDVAGAVVALPKSARPFLRAVKGVDGARLEDEPTHAKGRMRMTSAKGKSLQSKKR